MLIKRIHPKYVWIARAQINEQPIFALVFDSTDIPSGHFCIDFVLHDQSIGEFLLPLLKEDPDLFIDDNAGPKFGTEAYNKIISEIS